MGVARFLEQYRSNRARPAGVAHGPRKIPRCPGGALVVFTVRPYHHNIARAILKEPRVYFFDTGLVVGDEGAGFENACAAMLLKHAPAAGQSAHG